MMEELLFAMAVESKKTPKKLQIFISLFSRTPNPQIIH